MYVPHPGPQTAFLSAKIIPEVLFGGARGGGKLLSLSEVLPTPNGYVQLRDLSVGDILFDENGESCTVLELHPINLSPVSYRVHFDDGSFVDACEEHLWLTYDKKERANRIRRTEEFRAARRTKRPSRAKKNPVNWGVQKSTTLLNKERKYDYLEVPTGTVRTTKQILDSLRLPNGEVNHAIPVTKPIVLPHCELSIPPYVLGAWLGDGHRHSGHLTGIDPEIWEEIEKEGFKVTHAANCAKRHRIVGLLTLLKANNLYSNKHIPTAYLRASKEQRLALLQGLMDADGTVTDSGSAEFCNTNKQIIDGVYDLICSLGWKARIREGRSKLNGIDKGPKWSIKWTPTEIVFRLPRKATKQRIAKGWTTKWRYIVSVEPIAPIPMRCIKVSSPSSLFLVSRSFIPTHNTAGLLADYLQDVYEYKAAWQGVLFRRTYPELEEVIKQSFRFYPETGGTFKVGTRTWSWPGGASLKLRSLECAEDATKYQGHEYCVELGTLIETPSGPKRIEDLRTGDKILTASGVSTVSATLRPKRALCVEVRGNGSRQAHPIDHEFLTSLGWRSYASLLDIDATTFEEESPKWKLLPSLSVQGVCVPPFQQEDTSDEGVQGNTHTYNHPYGSRYPHPYGGWALPMVRGSFLTACEVSVIGYRDVMDIQVARYNNYITTGTRIINKNCFIGWDEVTNWPDSEAYQMLIGCLRSSVGRNVPARIRASGNPGGVGHQWVKDRWQIGKYKDGFVPIKDEDSGMTRMYIPSRTRDNPSLLLNSPDYEQRLRAVGSEQLVKAWLEGDWEVVLGAYFDEWDEKKHVINDVEMDDIPPHWKIYRAYDHGSYHPFCVLWYTVAGNEWGDIPAGTIIILREWWGGDEEGKGIKMSVAQIGEGIAEREYQFHRKVDAGPADGQIFEEDGGRPLSEILSSRGAFFFRADKRRVPGWNQVRNRLGNNLLKVCRCCKFTRITLPALQHDRSRPEDVDTTGNDHAADVMRYICQAWPITPQPRNSVKKRLQGPGFAELIDAADELLKRQRL